MVRYFLFNLLLTSYSYAVLHEQTVDAGESTCLEVPQMLPKQTHFAVWPDNTGGTCTCPLCYGNGNCTLDKCPCYDSSFVATWSSSIRHADNPHPQLCWSNVNENYVV